MVYFLRKFCAGMCCLALIGAFTAVSAAPATIHANAYMQTIYVDGQEAKFSNSEGKTAYLFSCNGVTYICPSKLLQLGSDVRSQWIQHLKQLCFCPA